MKKLLLMFLLFVSFVSRSQEIPEGYVLLYVTEANNMLVTTLRINGRNANFIIDTGASRSIIDINQSNTYKFNHYQTNKKYAGIGGNSYIYGVYDIEVSGVSYVPFVGADLSEVFSYFMEDGIYILGILGADFLSGYGAIIDYRNNKVYIKK